MDIVCGVGRRSVVGRPSKIRRSGRKRESKCECVGDGRWFSCVSGVGKGGSAGGEVACRALFFERVIMVVRVCGGSGNIVG